jgi:hypothetical protein
MRKIWMLAVLGILGISGCYTMSSGFDRGALYADLEKKGPLQVTEESVKKALEIQPQLTLPCKIAIYLYEPGGTKDWRWSAKDKDFILHWMDALKKDGLVADAFIMAGMFAKGNTMEEIRLSAAQHGADAVLVLKAAYQTDSYVNAAALLNLTILGGYVIPASHRDALFLIQGGLVDVANGFLYATMEAEGEGSIMRPTFTVQDKDAVEQAKKQALENLGPELLRRLRNLRFNNGRPTVHLSQPIAATQPPAAPRLEAPQTGSQGIK